MCYIVTLYFVNDRNNVAVGNSYVGKPEIFSKPVELGEGLGLVKSTVSPVRNPEILLCLC